MLTDEEKTALESMDKEEKKEFFMNKKNELKAVYLKHEAVIDKLLNGESLTSEDKQIVEEIKTKRAERKMKMEERKAKMESIKEIITKKKAGETLTDEEQTLLDSMKSFKKLNGSR